MRNRAVQDETHGGIRKISCLDGDGRRVDYCLETFVFHENRDWADCGSRIYSGVRFVVPE